jgi:hypothetical protein
VSPNSGLRNLYICCLKLWAPVNRVNLAMDGVPRLTAEYEKFMWTRNSQYGDKAVRT